MVDGIWYGQALFIILEKKGANFASFQEQQMFIYKWLLYSGLIKKKQSLGGYSYEKKFYKSIMYTCYSGFVGPSSICDGPTKKKYAVIQTT
jgi:hypothetical protein